MYTSVRDTEVERLEMLKVGYIYTLVKSSSSLCTLTRQMTFMPSPPAKKARDPIKLIRGINSASNVAHEEKPNVTEDPEVESLNHQFKLVNINLEPYIEDYVLENYFKLYKLQAFQTKGTSHFRVECVNSFAHACLMS